MSGVFEEKQHSQVMIAKISAIFCSLVELETSNRSWGEATNADSTIWEIESKIAIRVAKWLRGSDWVAQVLDDVQHLSLFCNSNSLHLRLELDGALLVISAANVGLGEQKFALSIRGFVELNDGAKDRQPDAE